MSTGKKAIWKLANPMREDSAIRQAWIQPSEPLRLTREPNLRSSPAFLELYGVDDDSPCEEDVCRHAASALMPLLEIEANYSTIAKFLSFLGHTKPEFHRLLNEKDPQALLLLAYWYAKMCLYKQWWNRPRAILECQAICIYLERYYSHETLIQMLLEFPRAMSGLGNV